MSVIFYSADELANLAVSAVGGSVASDSGKRALARNISALSQYAIANRAAYVDSYGEAATTPVVTFEDIRAAVGPYNNRPAAIRTLGGLAYNAVSQRGKDFLDEQTAKSLLSMATRFLS